VQRYHARGLTIAARLAAHLLPHRDVQCWWRRMHYVDNPVEVLISNIVIHKDDLTQQLKVTVICCADDSAELSKHHSATSLLKATI
jgi:hypothetical protein